MEVDIYRTKADAALVEGQFSITKQAVNWSGRLGCAVTLWK